MIASSTAKGEREIHSVHRATRMCSLDDIVGFNVEHKHHLCAFELFDYGGRCLEWDLFYFFG